MRFADVPGLAEFKKRLVQSVQNGKIAHAQLFMGPEGALNLPLALAYTTYLHCTNRGEDDACGECPACQKSQRFVHPDTHFVFPVSNVKGDKDEDRFRADIRKSWRTFLTETPFGDVNDWTRFYGGEDKQANISKEESREIIKTLSLKSFESPLKVMIIWQPEYMHPSAANGILKILEEPPAQTFFLLVSNSPERLLSTILSRTQQLMVPLMSDADVDAYLQRFELDEKQRAKIVNEAEGNLRLALDLREAETTDVHEQLAMWLRACFKRDVPKLIGLADDFHEFDRQAQQSFLKHALVLMRESLLVLGGANELLRSRDGDKKFVQDFSKVMTVTRVDRGQQLLSEAAFHLERNGSAKMIFLDLSMQLSAVLTR
ncbi:MAG TPA: DNA polymerase III subunit delta [Cyclobacteriaceae bacterium]|nr:DNA polymerase III subunit delta [Cyclobacteriaceae bacterium]